jgi:hypothetical protein
VNGTKGPYYVTFIESGLPNVTNWSVDLGGLVSGSVSSSINFTVPNGTYSFSASAAGYNATPSNGNVTVAGGSVTTVISFSMIGVSNYLVTFTELGLMNGTNWSVNLAGQLSSSTSGNISFWEPNGNFAYTVPKVGGLYPDPPLGNATVTGGSTQIGISFSASPAYAVQFQANVTSPFQGTPWEVYAWGPNLSQTASSVTQSVEIFLTNGTYNYTILFQSTANVSATPSNGTFTVAGAVVYVALSFGWGPTEYFLVFLGSGLPNGDSWCLSVSTISGCGSPSLGGWVRNGTYPFTIGAPAGYLANPSSGNITVAGAAVSVTVTFTIGATVNQVVFLESGLATGTNWAVTLGNLTQWSSGANDSFTVVNGQYLYTVGSVAGYNVSGGSGWVNVSGTPVTLSVTFTAAGNLSLYPVAIVESGLVNGTTWSASLGAASLSSATSTLTFLEGNGTYSLSVHAVTGFNVSAPSGVTISGSPVTVSVAFTVASNSSSGARTFTVMLAESGLPNGTVWGASFGGSVQSSSATTIVYTEPNGTYVLTISPPTNYTANFSSPVLVNGTAVTAAIVFSAVTYPVTFLEAGLPSGALWSVSATNEATHAVTSGQSTGTSLVLRLSEGAYNLVATGPDGYRVALSSTTISVAGGSSAASTATFTATTSSGLSPASLPWSTLATLVATALIGSVGAGWGYTKYRSERLRTEAQRWAKELNEGHFPAEESSPPPGPK